jgi:exosortase
MRQPTHERIGTERGWRTALPIGLALFAAAFVLCLPTLLRLPGTWSANQYYAHVVVMGLVAAWLLHSERFRVSRALREARPPSLGFLFVLAAAAFQVLMDLGDARWIAGLGIPLLLATIAHAVGGVALLRPLIAPLVCVALMIPPGPLLSAICDHALRPLVSGLALLFLRTSSVPVLMQGHRLEIPGHWLLLKESCCGVPAMLSLLVIGFLVTASGVRGRLHRFALVASVVPLVAVLNAIRVAVAAHLIPIVGPLDAQTLLSRDLSIPTIAAGVLWILGLARLARARNAGRS